MDSRLKRLAILAAVLIVSAVVAAVLAVNVWQNGGTLTRQKAAGAFQEKPPAIENTDYSAFLGDETFFDRDKSDYEKMMENYGKKLSLFATSIEKDLRVQIVNDLGELVEGKELYITVNGEEYKDLDQDGVVYVGDLKPGEYEVALEAFEDYRVPQNPLTIHVKEKIEYVPIEDISLLIKTEADIDAEAEDTQANGAREDADRTEDKEIRQTEGNVSFGIDVSKWNKEIDWEKVKASGVDFAIIRCGYRGSVTGALVEDPYFYQNIEGAKKAGVEVGLYFFTQAVSPVEAVEEASMVLCLNAGQPLDYPIFIDTEGAGGNGRADRLDVNGRTEVCRAFCETIENAGYRSGIYASRNWYYHNLDMQRLSDPVIWLAEYRAQPEYTGKYEMWQYTSDGSIDGIDGRVDFDISYKRAADEKE